MDFPFSHILGKCILLNRTFKLGAVERNVAVWWTMVIAGRYRAATADFTENLRWEDFSQDALTYRPVTLICSRTKMFGEGEGGLAKVMRVKKQLRSVEETRILGELEKLKLGSEGCLEQH